jgi:excisionase family DNA binding protein
MTAVTTPPLSLPTDHNEAPSVMRAPSQAITAPAEAAAEPIPSTPKPSQAVRPGHNSLTIGQAAGLTGLHKNTVRAYIKQGRLAARVVRGKYGQEYRLDRADVVALADQTAAVAHSDLGDAFADTPELEARPDSAVGAATPSSTSQPFEKPGTAEDSLGVTETADPSLFGQPSPHSASNLSLEPLVGLLRQVQEENRNLAGQLGFVQAQLQQAKETIRLLQAPPEMVESEEGGVLDEATGRIAAAEEVGRLRAELDQARQRVAEFEAMTDELEREQAAAAELARRPWWRFWG